MKKLGLILLLASLSMLFSAYVVGDTVNAGDNISWTISGPAGNPDLGSTGNIFDMVASGKPVVIFCGQTW